MANSTSHPTIAVLGASGDLGGGLAYRWSKAGYPIVIGSRTQEKAEQAAEELVAKLQAKGITDASVVGMENSLAAKAGEIVALTVPFSHQKSTLELVKPSLEGKILIDVTVPLMPPKVGRVQLPEEGSAGQIAQNLLGENVQVVSAFQNIAADHLNSDHKIECDVLVCGNKRAARDQVISLVEAAGMKGWHAGPIHNAAAVEAMTSVLITINKIHKIDSAGFVMTGEPKTS